MHLFRFRSLLLTLLGLSLLVAACSGGDSNTAVTGEDPSGDTESTDTDITDDGSTVEPSTLQGVEGITPPDLTGPVNPESVANLVVAVTGSPPGSEELTCLLDNSEGDSQLTEVFNGFGTQGYVLEPEGFTALTVNTHECVDNESLLDSLAALSVLEDEGATEYRSCVSDRIGDETNGDLVYTGLAALLVGFAIPEGATEFTFDAVIECVTPADLAEQIAFQSESQQGFTIEVDRECIVDGLTEEMITDFWGTFILQSGDDQGVMDLIESCSAEFDSGLEQEIPADFEPWAGVGALSGVDPFVRNGVYTEPPPFLLEDGVDYQAILTTSDGEITIDLFEETAPITVNNFVALARDGFYDATTFHRVLENFMAQGGDPTGIGSGGPGYSFEDEQSALTDIDRRGLLAMANAGPDTNGSQFFITFESQEGLTGLHAVFGELIESDEIFSQVDLRNPDAPSSRGEQLISVVITEN